jgi:phosphoribosylamine-glycine ligase
MPRLRRWRATFRSLQRTKTNGMAIPIRLLKRRERRAPVTALGKDLRAAQAAAYAAVETIHFEGAHFRRDIAAKALL